MINEIYKNILFDLWENGKETSPRGMKVKEILGYKTVLDNPLDNIITIPKFKTNVEYAKEEFRWYLSGSDRIDFSKKIERIWEKYSDDGQHVNSAYGFYFFTQRMSNSKMQNQWDWIKEKLTTDKDSRQAVFNINQMYHKYHETKDFPCTIYTQVFNRDNKLHWITNMRSNDIYFGFRNDLYTLTKLQEKLAKELDLGLGQYIHFAGNMHLYEPQYKKVKELYDGDT